MPPTDDRVFILDEDHPEVQQRLQEADARKAHNVIGDMKHRPNQMLRKFRPARRCDKHCKS